MKKILLLASAMALIGAPVLAQSQNCGPRDTVVERLQGKYAEGVHARGLAQNGAVVIEVWGSVETGTGTGTGTWTITVTNPAGLTCLIGSGQSFETLDPEPIALEDEGDPT